jgi:hypothetical protein
MKLTWIQWTGGIETRDDGYTIYKDIRFVMLKHPNGRLQKFRTAGQAKRSADKQEQGGQNYET